MKKLLALIIAIALMATLSVTAFAAENNEIQYNASQSSQTSGLNVTYNVTPTFTVTIPAEVTIDAEGSTATVSADNVVVKRGEYVSVTLAADNNFKVTTTEDAELTYTVTANGKAVAAGGEILAVNPAVEEKGSVEIIFDIDESAIQYAGTYTGIATFTIAVKSV